MHDDAVPHLPPFIPGPGEVDALFWVALVILVLAAAGLGSLYLVLHSLPERIAHAGQKAQFQLVAVLGLIALFTHERLFWIAALLLALVRLPDIGGTMARVNQSLARIASVAEERSSPRAPATAPSIEAPPPDKADPGAERPGPGT